MKKFRLILVLSLLACSVIPRTAFAHECDVEEDEVSFHFQTLSVTSLVHIIANYSKRQMVFSSKRDLQIPLHYNCERWQDILEDLSEKYLYVIEVTDESIIVKDP